MTQALDIAALYLQDVRKRLHGVKALGDGALAQLRDDDWHRVLSDGGNSAAVLTQHLHGNMRARWGALEHGYREALEGEPTDRDRDAEFVEGTLSPDDLRRLWEDGWALLFRVLDALTPADLGRPLTIRSQTHSVLEAVQRQIAHYSGHVYQLIFLVKTLRGSGWQTLSIPRGGSAAFNAAMMRRP